MHRPHRLFGLILALSVAPGRLVAQTPADTRQQIEAHARKAAEFLKAQQPDLAAGELEAIIRLDPQNADAHANLGVLLFFKPDYAKAEPELRGALHLRPEMAKIRALLGLCERQLGEMEHAREDLAQAFPALTEEKIRVEVGMRLTEIYYSSGDLDEAATVVSQLRKLRPADPNILYTAQRVYADLADECMLGIAMTSPHSARLRQLMGNEFARRGNAQGAILEYREALKIDPRLPGLHFQLAEMLISSPLHSDRKEAEQQYQQALELNPLDVRAECRLGEIALEQSDLETARVRYSHALAVQPNDAEANLGMAKVLMGTGKSPEAEPYLKRAIQIEPFDATAHIRLAAVYRATGRAAEASRETAEFERLRDMKIHLGDVYHEMNVELPAGERRDQETLKSQSSGTARSQ